MIKFPGERLPEYDAGPVKLEKHQTRSCKRAQKREKIQEYF